VLSSQPSPAVRHSGPPSRVFLLLREVSGAWAKLKTRSPDQRATAAPWAVNQEQGREAAA
jgi:hypothetical protein